MEQRKIMLNAFKTMYENVVNNPAKGVDVNAPEYISAKDYIYAYYSKLDDGVVEFLGAFMLTHPGKRILFSTSDKQLLDLNCLLDEGVRSLSFNKNGTIVRDEMFPYVKEKD